QLLAAVQEPQHLAVVSVGAQRQAGGEGLGLGARQGEQVLFAGGHLPPPLSAFGGGRSCPGGRGNGLRGASLIRPLPSLGLLDLCGRFIAHLAQLASGASATQTRSDTRTSSPRGQGNGNAQGRKVPWSVQSSSNTYVPSPLTDAPWKRTTP